jgi:hypothetical protein
MTCSKIKILLTRGIFSFSQPGTRNPECIPEKMTLIDSFFLFLLVGVPGCPALPAGFFFRCDGLAVD